MTLMHGKAVRWILTLVSWYAMTASSSAQGLVINEIMPANSITISDENGDFPDWIELFNAGANTLSLENYGLSDIDSTSPKWTFPDLVLDPGDFLVVYASEKNRNAPPLHWQTIINWGDEWKYLVPTQEPPAEWNTLAFNDQNWNAGKSGFGYGDNDDSTQVPVTMSVYIRKTFLIDDTGILEEAILHMDYDDSFVAYLNGKEVARGNIGIPGVPPAFNQAADNYNHEALIYRGLPPESFRIDSLHSLIREGENVLAIQVHNHSTGSSDLTAIPFFSIGSRINSGGDHPVPPLLPIDSPLLHTNFKLDAEGETVYLYDLSGTIVDSIACQGMYTDLSSGRYPDGSGNLYYFQIATPGESNGTTPYTSISGEPYFSSPGGLFTTSVTVYLTGKEADDTIYYTTDGSEPSIYSEEYAIGGIFIESTTVLRARILEHGKIPGRVVSHTYLINPGNTLPVISLTTSPENLWDYYDGMYVMGPNASQDFPHFGANFWQDWEKPVHIELFEPDGDVGFSIDAGMKIFGGWSRGLPQKSLSLFARSQYGYGTINYRIFYDKNIDQFEAIVLRNSGNDWNYSMMRDGMMTSLVRKMDIDLQAYRPAEIYLNGDYWGILNIREKVNEHFIASNHNVNPDSIDLLEGNGWEIHGSAGHYFTMLNFINNNNMQLDENLKVVQSMMETDQFTRYQISQIYFDNRDWPGNNIKFWRPQTETGRWRWIMYDTDFGFGIWDPLKYNFNTLAYALEPNGPEWPNPPWSTFLLRKLMENNRFKTDFINCFADHLNTTFRPDKVKKHILILKQNIEEEMHNHLIRWGGNYSNWENEIQVMINFGNFRVNYVRNHILNQFSINGTFALNMGINPAYAGKVKVNTVLPERYPWQGLYFDHIPITLIPVPEPGYRFTGWTGSSQSTEHQLTLDVSADQQITANFEPDGSGLQYIVINEINYNSSDYFDTGDWIEIYNRGDSGRDITGWILKDSDDEHQFIFPSPSHIDADGYLVVCRDDTAFVTLYPYVANCIGDFDFGLSSYGDCIRLYDDSLRLVDSVCYGVSSPWSPEPNGTGPSLELINPSVDNTLPEYWYASNTFGTPGAINDSWSPLSIEEKEQEKRNDFDLLIYPNPFNSIATLQIYLEKEEHVRISIHDITGRTVVVLYEGILINGFHQWNWDATASDGARVSSGIYLIKAETKNNYLLNRIIYQR